VNAPLASEPKRAVVLELPGRPVAKERPRFNKKTGRVFTPKRTRDFEGLIQLAALSQRVAPLEGDLEMEVCLYLPDKRRRDLDNLLKTLMDGGNGCLYHDDSQVTRIVVEKHVDRERPRTRVAVRQR
jgi:crossover junction endodeoxyribonuclease RusA